MNRQQMDEAREERHWKCVEALKDLQALVRIFNESDPPSDVVAMAIMKSYKKVIDRLMGFTLNCYDPEGEHKASVEAATEAAKGVIEVAFELAGKITMLATNEADSLLSKGRR